MKGELGALGKEYRQRSKESLILCRYEQLMKEEREKALRLEKEEKRKQQRSGPHVGVPVCDM